VYTLAQDLDGCLLLGFRLECCLEQLFGLLGLGVVGEEVEEVVEVVDGGLERFGGGGEAAGVEAVAGRWLGGGEVVEGEVEGVWPIGGGSVFLLAFHLAQFIPNSFGFGHIWEKGQVII
jgi:hypothetical protein